MSVTVGGVTDDRVPDFVRAMGGPFLFDIPSDRLAGEVARFRDRFPLDRLRCAYDGDTIVGTLGAFSLDMTCPGGTIPCAGTTVVTVQPTHRRQGILRRLIDDHFDDARERGEPIAALFASDSAIYGRFGYGMASVSAELRIERPHVALHRLAPPVAPVRMLEPGQARPEIEPVFDAMRRTRPGMFARDAAWWRASLEDDERDRGRNTAYRYVVADGTGGAEGYARYRIEPGDWSTGHAEGTVQVGEIVSTTPSSAASLWSFLTSIDLVGAISAGMVPEDDPVFDLFAGWRRVRPTLTDQLWVRLLDVPAALAGRQYEADGSVSFTVRDPITGTVESYRLDVEGGVGTCSAATDGDIRLDMEDLGAAYLGRPRFRALAGAGRVTGPAPALALADRIFCWHPAPWCQQIF